VGAGKILPGYSTTKVSDTVPCVAGLALKCGASMTANLGVMGLDCERVVICNEHVPREQTVPREFVLETDRQAVLWRGACPGVDHK
jgi:hypothetical protein